MLKENGEPDPGLAIRIANDEYEPATLELRTRLGLPPIRPPALPRRTPAWVDQAVENLKMLRERRENHC